MAEQDSWIKQRAEQRRQKEEADAQRAAHAAQTPHQRSRRDLVWDAVKDAARHVVRELNAGPGAGALKFFNDPGGKSKLYVRLDDRGVSFEQVADSELRIEELRFEEGAMVRTGNPLELTVPGILRTAEQLGPSVREQLVRPPLERLFA